MVDICLWQTCGAQAVWKIHVISGCLSDLVKKEFRLLNGWINGKFLIYGYIRSNRKDGKDQIFLKTMHFITEMTDKYPLLQYL